MSYAWDMVRYPASFNALVREKFRIIFENPHDCSTAGLTVSAVLPARGSNWPVFGRAFSLNQEATQ